jgi:glutamate 5-kinase
MKNSNILVVKYGSSSVSNAMGVDQARIESYASKLAELSGEYQIAVVSSGAVTAGRAISAEIGERPRAR